MHSNEGQDTSTMDSLTNEIAVSETAVSEEVRSLSDESAVDSLSNGVCSSSVSNRASGQSLSRLSNRDSDILRIIAQHLRNLGLERTVDELASESGLTLEHPQGARLKNFVMEGHWDLAEKHLDELKSVIHESLDIRKMRFLILEQKYLELLGDGLVMDALKCLRGQITPLNCNTDHVHQLSSYLMYKNVEDIKRASKWLGKGQLSRLNLLKQLQAFIPASVMIPSNRLQELFKQAVRLQTDRCLYHNTPTTSLSLDNISLLHDHYCSSEQLPCVTTQCFQEKYGEFWHCKFSPDGRRLAAGTNEGSIIIYRVNTRTGRLKKRMTYSSIHCRVSFLTWSPDNIHLIICGPDPSSELCVRNVINSDTPVRLNENGLEEHVSCAAWLPDGLSFVTGGLKGQAVRYDMSGTKLDTWQGIRAQCMQCLPYGHTVIAADTQYRVRGFNFDNCSETFYFREDHPIISFTLNRTASHILLNVATQGLNMWDLHSRTLVRRFQGIAQGYFAIYSAFGGENEAYIASGSEDSTAYIWNWNKELPIAGLSGHTGTVNCIDWNPVVPWMLATCSDDWSVRIWGPASIDSDISSSSSSEQYPFPLSSSASPPSGEKLDTTTSSDTSEELNHVSE